MRSLLLVLILSTTTFGCGSKEGKDTTDHPSTSDQPQATGPHAADDKATEDLQAKRADEAKVADTKAAADAQAVKDHATTQAQLQASFDASDRRFNELKEKLAKMSATKNAKANAKVADAKTNETTVMASIATLRDAPLPQWDTAKAKADTDFAAFNKSIDVLASAI
jgi:hypothetical protein